MPNYPAGDNRIQTYRGDALAILPALPANSVDAIITDPPYSSGGFTRGDRTANPSDKYVNSGVAIVRESFSGDNRDGRSWCYWTALWLSECHRIVKPSGYALIFSDWRQLTLAADALQAGGFVWRGIIVWDKTEAARPPHTGYFRHQCEYIVWGTKGVSKPATHGGPFAGCFRVPVLQADKLHMTGKPTALMSELVKCVPPDGTILDPFMKSGTTGKAAWAMGRRFIGIEQAPVNRGGRAMNLHWPPKKPPLKPHATQRRCSGFPYICMLLFLAGAFAPHHTQSPYRDRPPAPKPLEFGLSPMEPRRAPARRQEPLQRVDAWTARREPERRKDAKTITFTSVQSVGHPNRCSVQLSGVLTMHNTTWEAVEAELKALYSEPFARKATWLKHRQVIRLMARFAPSPKEFDVPALCRLAAHLNETVAPMTVNSLLVVARCQLNYLDAQGYTAKNPWKARKCWRVKVPKGDPRHTAKKHQSIDEIVKLMALAAAEVAQAPTELSQWKARRLQSLVVFTVFTGCRAGESLHLRRDELELPRNIAWVTETSHRTKTEASVRMVPVAPQAVDILRPWVDSLPARTDYVFPCITANKPWLHGSTSDRPLGQVKALGERADIPAVTLLSLRHTFTTHARQMMGLSREQVQAILGHASPITQNHYDEPDIDNVRRLAQQIRFNVFDPDPKKETA